MLAKLAETLTKALHDARGGGRSLPAARKAPRGRLERLEDRLLLSVNAEEQLFVYLVNRARHDPVAYQQEQQLSVDLSYIPALGPLAINEDLSVSADFHAEEMATYDYFGHQSEVTGEWPNKMVRDTGYPLPSWWEDGANYVESIAAGGYATYASAPAPLEALIVDVDVPSLGHRHHLLGFDVPGETVFQVHNREIGVGYAYNSSSHYEHYWAAHIAREEADDRFLTGVVFDDLDGNGLYDLNEGLAGVTLAVGQQSTTTNAHGGWSLEVSPGSYTVMASGGGFFGTAGAAATVTDENVEVDFISGLTLGLVDFEFSATGSQNATTTEDTAVEITLAGINTNPNAPQTFAVATPPNHGTLSGLDAATGRLTYTPHADYNGPDSFQYTVASAAAGLTGAIVTVAIDVTAVNDRPVAGTQSLATDVNAAVEFTPAADDGDPETVQTLTFAIVRPPEHGALSDFDSTTGKATYTPNADYHGPDSFRFTVTDDGTAGEPAGLTGATVTVPIDVVRHLGTIDLHHSSDLDPLAGDLWFRFTALRDGILTAEINTQTAAEQFPAETSMTLLRDDGTGNLLELASATPRIDYTGAVGGEEYLLRVSGLQSTAELTLGNLVQISADTSQLTVHGTDGDDSFEISVGVPHVVTVDGLRYESGSAIRVYALAGEGSDSVTLSGTEAKESATLHPTSAVVTGSGYEMLLIDFSSIALHGGGGADVAEFYDSAGDDNFSAKPAYATMDGEGFDNRVHDFPEVYAEATAGGVDVAKLYDSPHDDTYIATPVYSAVFAEGFHHEVTNFEGVHTYATAGGIDVAKFYDSAGDDNFVTSPTYAAMFNAADDGQDGVSFFNRAKFFEGVHAFATAGGLDVARFYDSPANDNFIATPDYAALYNADYREQYTQGFHNRAKFFEATHAFATAGDHDIDVARLYDSPGDDTFYADPTEASLFSPTYDGQYNGSFYNRAKFFQGVHAFATYGRDDGTPGGRDLAYLKGSDGNDLFYADPVEGALFRPDQFYNRAHLFEEVYADAQTGDNDRAYLNDSPAADLIEADDNRVRLSNAALDFLIETGAFDYVKATAATSGNKQDLPDLDLLKFELDLDGLW